MRQWILDLLNSVERAVRLYTTVIKANRELTLKVIKLEIDLRDVPSRYDRRSEQVSVLIKALGAERMAKLARARPDLFKID
jgi:hypothetical protein